MSDTPTGLARRELYIDTWGPERLSEFQHNKGGPAWTTGTTDT